MCRSTRTTKFDYWKSWAKGLSVNLQKSNVRNVYFVIFTGKVYKGELKAKSGKIFVAVKSLKENATAKTQADFQREIELISELKHPNIICLLGVITKKEPMCMLFEFMSEVCVQFCGWDLCTETFLSAFRGIYMNF